MSSDLTLLMLAAGGSLSLCSAAFLFGFNKTVKISDQARARQFVHDYAPSANPTIAVLSSDCKSAMVACDKGDVFFVYMLGDSPIVRPITARDVKQIDAGNLDIEVNDIGFPPRIFSADATLLKPILQAFNQGAMQ